MIKDCFFSVIFLLSVVSSAGAQSPLISAEPPKNPEIARGVDAALKGDVADAEQFFAEALAKKPGSRPGGIDAAMAFAAPEFEFQHFGKLRFWLEKTTDDYPKDPEAFLLLGDIALSDGRLLEARMLAEHASKLVDVFDADLGRRQALRIYTEKLLSSVAEQKKNWNEALSRLTTLRELEPESGEHLYRLGIVQFRLGRKDEAVVSLNAAASKDTKILPALIVLAQLAETEGKTDEAAKLIAESLEKDSGNPQALVAAADLELRWNQLAKVKELAEKAFKIDPTFRGALMTLGIVDLYDGKFEDAEEKFSTLVSTSPEDSSALIGLTLALCEQADAKQLRRAYGYGKANAEKNPGSVDAQITLAWVLIKANALDEAEKILVREFDSGDLNSPGAYYLAVVFSQRERKDEAILFLKNSLATKVNFPKRVAAEALLKNLIEQGEK